MKKFCAIIFLFLSGCSAVFRGIKIESDCYIPFTRTVSEFFPQSKDGDVYVWETPKGYIDEDFFKKEHINGNLIPENFINSKVIISGDSMIKLTGRVFKFWPSWGEYYIGGGRKKIQLEATINGSNYLIFNYYIPKNLKKSMENRCKFD